ARLHDGDPAFRRALALAHARLGRLLRVGLVREDVDPDLAAALDLAGHRDTGSLDLAVGDPTGLERLDAVLAEVDVGLTGRVAATAAAVHLPELGLLGQQHQLSAFLRGARFLGASADFSVFSVAVGCVSGASATGAGVVSTCGSITGCSRPSFDTPLSSVRGRSTFSGAVPRWRSPAGRPEPRPRGAPP